MKLNLQQERALYFSAFPNGKALEEERGAGRVNFKTGMSLLKRGLVSLHCDDKRRGPVIRITEKGKQFLGA